MRILQINTTVNGGSTGRIAEEIGKMFLESQHESHIAYGRGTASSASQLIKVGNDCSIYLHALRSLLFDQHGRGSVAATRSFIGQLEQIKPDVIGIHNIHGYYLNFEILFEYLQKANVPVVWTLHDCWPFTGHCAHFDFVGCRKWESQCGKCPLTSRYPTSLFVDNSRNNFQKKKRLFTGLSNLLIVTPSHWLKRMVQRSFLSAYDVQVINNGVDLDLFRVLPQTNISRNSKKVVLGVASTWDRIKGLADFVKLRPLLPDSVDIVLIGLSKRQINSLPDGIMGISRTENIDELVEWYNRADVFVNPTYVDNFPTTNLEALACGTPVVTYDSGGSPEAIDRSTGSVVTKGDILGLKSAIEGILLQGKAAFQPLCRTRAENNYNKMERFEEYYRLYNRFIADCKVG